ncbi:MAG TPA: AI-2E family transporter, partial [Opitutaceae bacterium]
PDYESTIRDKVQALKTPHMPPVLTRAAQMVEKLRADIVAPPPKKVEPEAPAPEVKPQPVEVHAPQPTPVQLAREIIGPILGPLATGGIVIVVVVAMLFQREDLRDRLIRLCSAGRLNVAIQVLDDAARRVSRYLLMQLVVNASYGIPVGLGLYLIGIPNALLWGLLATLLRFIPFLGPWIAALFPIALAVAVDPGWTKLAYTLALFVLMEVVSNNIIEVWLYGSGTGISSVALLVAAVFWTWLWGPAGLFLSTPLTVCLLVLGRHVPGLKFLGVLLGSEPVLPPDAQFYQRMLSMDPEGMLDLASKFISERSAAAFYDEIFIPALTMAEADRHAGTLAERRQKFIFETSRELIEELERQGSADEETPPDAAGMTSGEQRPALVIIPASDDADELAALMLRHLLRERRIQATVTMITTPPDDTRALVAGDRAELVVVSAVPPAAAIGARRACRRLRRYGTRAPVIVGIWSRETTAAESQIRLQLTTETVVTQLADAALRIERQSEAEVSAVDARSAPETAPSALHRREPEPAMLFDSVIREVAQVFEVPVALVNLVETDQAFWRAHAAHRPREGPVHSEPTEDLLLRDHVVATDTLLVVEDVTKDRRFTSDSFLIERGIRFYACAPLRTQNGLTVGYLCVVDTRARQINDQQEALLKQRATDLIAALEASGTSQAPLPADPLSS